MVVVFVTKPYAPSCCTSDNFTQTATMKPTTYSELLLREADPRYLALEWILHDDVVQLTVNDANLMQRFILALLAFSFDLFSWDCGFVYGLGSCLDWKWDFKETNSGSYDYALWLSGTDECLRYGVSCFDGVVTGLDLREFKCL